MGEGRVRVQQRPGHGLTRLIALLYCELTLVLICLLNLKNNGIHNSF